MLSVKFSAICGAGEVWNYLSNRHNPVNNFFLNQTIFRVEKMSIFFQAIANSTSGVPKVEPINTAPVQRQLQTNNNQPDGTVNDLQRYALLEL